MNNYKISGNIVDIFNNEIYKGIIEIKMVKLKISLNVMMSIVIIIFYQD